MAAMPASMGLKSMLSLLGNRASSVVGHSAFAGGEQRFGSSAGSMFHAERELFQGFMHKDEDNSAAAARPAASYNKVATQLASLGMLGSRSKSAFGSASSGSNLMQQRSSSGAWAAQQTMAMSSASQIQSGSVTTSALLGVWRFWRSQAPFEKPHTPVDSRLLPSLLAANDERASVGTWATALFVTILGSNLLGLTPFYEAPTAGLGFATGLGVSVWATATILGLYKLGHTFPGHFIPGGTPWPMAFIFVPLETISYTFRAVSLGVRLWVNMLAGHTLLHILTGMSLALPFSLPFYTGIPVTFAVGSILSALVGLEYLVAVLQSGVFAILSTVYIGEFNHGHMIAPLAKIVKKGH